MRISRTKLNRARYAILLYVVLSLFYSLNSLLNLENFYFEFFSITILTALAFYIYKFIQKFLRRYNNYNDNKHIFNWVIILLFVHNAFSLIYHDNLFDNHDFEFVFMIVFITLSLLLLAFYIALFNILINAQRKHFPIYRLFAMTYILVPLVLVLSVVFTLLQGDTVLSGLSKNYPSIVLALVQNIPFLVLFRLCHLAKFVRDS